MKYVNKLVVACMMTSLFFSVIPNLAAAGYLSEQDINKEKPYRTLKHGLAEILAATFNPTSELIATGGQDNKLTIWKYKEEKEPMTITCDSAVTSLSFMPDGKHLVAAIGKNVHVINMSTNAITTKLSLNYTINNIIISPKGNYMAVIGAEYDVYDTRSWQKKPRTATFSEKPTDYQRYLLSYTIDDKYAAISDMNEIAILDLNSMKQLKTIYKYQGKNTIASMTFHNNSSYIAIGTYKGDIKIYDVSRDTYVNQFKHDHTYKNYSPSTFIQSVESIAYATDGKILLTGGGYQNDNPSYTLKIWDANDYSLKSTTHLSKPFNATLSNDSKYVATLANGVVDIWEIAYSSKKEQANNVKINTESETSSIQPKITLQRTSKQKQIPISPIIQQSPVWCWAAVSEMYFRYKGVSSLSPAGHQCAAAALIAPACNNNCANCITGAPSWTYFGQVVERYPRLVSTVLRNSKWLSFQFEDQGGAMAYTATKTAIDDDIPVFAGINPSSGINLNGVPQHVAMITGYSRLLKF